MADVETVQRLQRLDSAILFYSVLYPAPGVFLVAFTHTRSAHLWAFVQLSLP